MSTADYLDGYRDGFRAGWQSAAATMSAERTAGAEPPRPLAPQVEARPKAYGGTPVPCRVCGLIGLHVCETA